MQKAELLKSFAFGKTQNVFSHQRKDFIHCSLFIVHCAFAVCRAQPDKLKLEMEDSMKTTLTAPAKINLFLDITARRPDGYHEISGVMQTISLCS